MKINNKEVMQSYILTTAKYDYSVDEKRILLRLIETFQSLIKGEKLTGKINKTKHGKFELQFPISHFISNNQTNYNRVRNALKNLNEKKFEYEDCDRWEIIRIIEMPSIEKREDVKFTLNPKIVDCFLDFSKGFRRFELETALSFESTYSIRLYELMSQQKTPITYTIQDLKSMFGLENKYSNVHDFTRFVLDLSKKELDKKSPFSFTYRLNKIGRKYTSITLIPVYIAQNSDEEIEKTSLRKQTSLKWDLDVQVIDYLKTAMHFTTEEIKRNRDVFKEAQELLKDILLILSELSAKSRVKANAKGWIIQALRCKIDDEKRQMQLPF